VFAGGVMPTEYDPAERLANEYEPFAAVVVVPMVVPFCVRVTETPARATMSTNTVPLMMPGSEVHAKFAVDA
jgi:hypothetical protein